VLTVAGQHLASFAAGNIAFIATLLSVFFGSLVAGLAGFAFSAIAGAMIFHWLAPVDAVPLLLACSITTQLLSIAKLWRSMEWRQCTPYLLGGLLGIPVGATLLESINPHSFAMGFGVFLTVFSIYMLLRPRLVLVGGGGPFCAIAAGFAGGITGGATAFPGAIPTIWCNARGLSKSEQRGVVQPFILCMQIATLVYFSKLGLFALTTWSIYFWCAPAVIAGTLLGLRFFHRIDDVKFRRVVLYFLLVSGVALVL
jgi:uncharacterized protein